MRIIEGDAPGSGGAGGHLSVRENHSMIRHFTTGIPLYPKMPFPCTRVPAYLVVEEGVEEEGAEEGVVEGQPPRQAGPEGGGCPR